MNHMNRNVFFIVLAVAAIIIAGAFAVSRNNVPAGTKSEYRSADVAGLPEAKSSDTVELKNGDTYALTASVVQKNINGTAYRMLAYNGSIPGPLIKVAQGAEVTVNFANDTDIETTLHSHGLRLDNASDGVSPVVQPGGTFAYTLKFPDAGMYWYHPHIREDYAQELGLYGNYLVVPSSADYWSPVNREVSLFLDDILIENNTVNLSKQEADRTLMGRFGNVMLVNGETGYALDVKKGEVVRFYLTNAANTRTFNFAIAGTKLKLVGVDGGAYEKDEWKDSVVVGPSERAVVEALFDASGEFILQNRTPDRTYALGTVKVGTESVGTSYASAFAQLSAHAEIIRSIDPFRPLLDKTPDKRITLSISMMGDMMDMQGMSGMGGHMMPDGTMMGGSMGMMGEVPEGGIEWEDDMGAMNARSNTDFAKWKIVDQDTGKENLDIDWTFKRGEPVKIRIFNDPNSMHPMQHPIHFHGQRFVVTARDGVPQTNLAWKDTVLVKAGETVDILLDTSNPGEWMAHCHIAEHLEAGMMFRFTVAT